MLPRLRVVPLSRTARRGKRSRKGAILILAAFFLVVMMGVMAFTIDLGYMTSARSDLQRATDSAALAGAGAIAESTSETETEAVVKSAAFEYFARNPVGGSALYQCDNWQTFATQWLAQHPDDFKMTLGHWDPTRSPGTDPNNDLRFYTDASKSPSAIWLKTQRTDIPSFFAKVLGVENFQVSAQTIARYQPRDIVLVLDFSGSMSYDSQLRRITDFGETARAAVEASLQQCYTDLNSPTYGTLTFTPQYVTLNTAWSYGVPLKSGNVSVTFRSSDIQISCTGTVSYTKLKLTFSDGNTETKYVSGTSGTYAGSSGKLIEKVQVYNNSYSTTLTEDAAAVKAFFNLTSVNYPYPGVTWDNWISYVKTSSYIKNAGYRNKYGFMTLINWWQESRNSYTQTCDLWKTHEQPVGTLKDACGQFFDFISEVKTDDHVSFVIYNSPSQTAQIENHLTTEFDTVLSTIQHRQAGHYDDYTNIGAGIQYAIQELNTNGRAGAFKMIVLMTDGNANKPNNETDAKAFVQQQALVAAGKRYPILTVCLGQAADSSLLQTVATTTNGAAFVVSGGATVTDYGPGLLEVFRKIADARPLQIVK